ncbi:hypothetical protein SLE2022_358400 [Rubroshorea leprosula]
MKDVVEILPVFCCIKTCYKRDELEPRGKWDTTIGAPLDFDLLDVCLFGFPFSFSLATTATLPDPRDEGIKQLKIAERKDVARDKCLTKLLDLSRRGSGNVIIFRERMSCGYELV